MIKESPANPVMKVMQDLKDVKDREDLQAQVVKKAKLVNRDQ